MIRLPPHFRYEMELPVVRRGGPRSVIVYSVLYPMLFLLFPGFKASRYTYDREIILHIGEACYGVESDQLQLLAFPELQPKARRNMGHTTRRGNVAGGEVPSGEWGA